MLLHYTNFNNPDYGRVITQSKPLGLVVDSPNSCGKYGLVLVDFESTKDPHAYRHGDSTILAMTQAWDSKAFRKVVNYLSKKRPTKLKALLG